MVEKKYEVCIYKEGTLDRTEVWSWFGQRNKAGEKVLHNHTLYAADTTLLMTDGNRITGGYSHVFNSSNILIVGNVTKKESICCNSQLKHVIFLDKPLFNIENDEPIWGCSKCRDIVSMPTQEELEDYKKSEATK